MEPIHRLFKLPETPLLKIEDDFLAERGITLFIKREDLNDPELSGNKIHKLKYNLLQAKEEGHTILLTFGGAYSNHIYAVAAAGKRFGFNTIGIIRGEEHLPLNPTLKFAASCGMNIYYMNRSTYRKKTNPEVVSELRDQFGEFYLIPEGGTNDLAVKGCREIINSISINFDIICAPCGTGGTLAGLIAGLNGKHFALGFAVLKGASFLNHDILNLLTASGIPELANWNVNLDYHFGGYAKIKTELLQFIKVFFEKTGVVLDPIYNGKMFYGIYDLISLNKIDAGTTIIAIHTGGLQGLEGMKSKFNLKNKAL